MTQWVGRVHVLGGYLPSGGRVRACCTCGWSTTPRVDERRALEALYSEHGYSTPECVLCQRFRGRPSDEHVHDDLEVLIDDLTGDEALVCRTDRDTCNRLYPERQRRLDRAAAAAQAGPPTLRLIPGGRAPDA